MSTERPGVLSILLDAARAGGAEARDRLVRDIDDEPRRFDLEALGRLARAHPRPAQVVDLHFFSGLSIPEVAELPAVSETTVEGDWRFARAWLRRTLGGNAV
jgi:DNA-directed RNA polymerase specialized sigma24 family protein